MDFGRKIYHLWNLDPKIVFLNNGSFGATPITVLEDFYSWVKKTEEEPVSFFVDQYFPQIRKTASEIGEFLGVQSDDLCFLDNATTGVNTILNSVHDLGISHGELLTTNMVYPAVRNAMKFYAKRYNLSYREIQIPFPTKGNSEILKIFEKEISPITRMVVVDHVSSATAIVFPIKDISELCAKSNALLLVDGAHAPGMLDFKISSLNCDFYTGNLHKWLFAPKGSAVLWVKKEYQQKIHPLTISLFYNQGFTHEFDWTGTKTPASYLSSVSALNFFKKFLPDIYSYRTNLLKQGIDLFVSEFCLETPAPNENLGTLASFILKSDKIKDANSLRKILLEKHNIELFTSDYEGQVLIRLSAQIFNEYNDYLKLASALKEII